jgi:2-(1,2-epoxy-1,2-dihydrophenyl)acetyl-CoA isomerase
MSLEQTPHQMVEQQEAGDVTILRMRDPGRSNALTPQMVLELIRAVSHAGGRALLICAAGRNFSSGGDHESFLELSVDGRRKHLAEIKELMSTIRNCPMPTVACMQGAVVGGGLEMALHCDLLIGADDARFQLSHVATGSKLRRTSYAALVDRTGVGFARRMSLLGDWIPAERALAAGLVDHVCRRADLDTTARSMAEQLAGQPVEAMQHARNALARFDPIGSGDTEGQKT